MNVGIVEISNNTKQDKKRIEVEYMFCNNDTIQCYPKNGQYPFITHYKSLVSTNGKQV